MEVPDLKETTSVLLQNMLDRLMVLEKQVENVVSQSASDISELSEKVKSLNQSLRSFAWNFTRGMYSFHIYFKIPILLKMNYLLVVNCSEMPGSWTICRLL